MRWLTYSFVLVTVLILQTSVAPFVAIGDIRPDWLLALATFTGLYARRKDAVMVGIILGLGADLQSSERLGVLTLCMVSAALLGNSVRHLVFLKNAVTHFVVTFAAALLSHSFLAVYEVVMYGGVGRGELVFRVLAISIWTAVWAPPMASFLLKMSQLFGLHTSRYSHSHLASAVR